MYTAKTIKYVQSVTILPLLVALLPISSVTLPTVGGGIASVQNQAHEEVVLTDTVDQMRAAKIDAYFQAHNLPLAGHGDTFIAAANKYDIPWNLAPAIAMRESTGGKFMFKKNNPFGWGARSFSSIDEAIYTIAWNLGGHNPNTARYYKDKSIDEILKSYNPPHVVYTYSDEVQGIMDSIAQTRINEKHLAQR